MLPLQPLENGPHLWLGETQESPISVRHLVKEAELGGKIRVIHVAGVGKVLELADGPEHDYVVLGACGHVSSFFTTLERAIRWRCAVCDEARWNMLNTRMVSQRLTYLMGKA